MSFIGVITMYNFYSINNIKRIIKNKSNKEYKESTIIPDEYTDVKELTESIFKYF